MATFNRNDATIQEVYVRRALPNGDNNYRRLAFNLIRYDNGETYVEPIAAVNFDQTWEGMHSVETDGEFLILDAPPFSGVTEIH
jgi:hypothetical protein